jgi:hypothetical protein
MDLKFVKTRIYFFWLKTHIVISVISLIIFDGNSPKYSNRKVTLYCGDSADYTRKHFKFVSFGLRE